MNFGEILARHVLPDVLEPVHNQQQIYGIVFRVVINEIWHDYFDHFQQLLESLIILKP